MTVNGEQAAGDLALRLIGVPSRLLKGWVIVTPGDRVVLLERKSTPPGGYLLAESASWEEPDPQSWTWNDVLLLRHDPDHVTFRVKGWLVRAARYWPGWTACVNGNPAEIRAYLGTLPAVHVKSGTSIVEWQYEPRSYTVGATTPHCFCDTGANELASNLQVKEVNGATPPGFTYSNHSA
jgi:hypothetical protein